MNIAALRLHNQHILKSTLTSPEEAVKWFGAVQAQEYLFSLWALGLRVPGSTEETIKKAITERKIIRTWPMRGTIHYVPAEDTAWMTALMAKRVNLKFKNQLEKMGLPHSTVLAAKPLLIKALEQGDHLTRAELYEKLEQGGIKNAKKFGLFIVAYWAQEGLLCFGIHRGKQPTFTLLEQWVPNQQKLTVEESLAEITRRYFQSHGPATLHDFAWWSGLTITEVKQGIKLVGNFLASHEYRGKQYFTATSLNISQPVSAAGSFLLPCFDEYTVSYKDRSVAVDQENLVNYGYGVNWNNIIIDGRITGAWKRTVKSKEVIIELRPVRELTKKETAQLFAKAAEFGRFIGLPANVVMTKNARI